MVSIVFYTASIGLFLTALFALQLLVGLGLGEYDAVKQLSFHVGVWGFFSVATLLALWGKEPRLSRMSAYYLSILLWLFLPLMFAFPIADLLNLDYQSALFETVSAFTTNGASLIKNYETTPKTAVLFLAIIQWVGGYATLLSIVVVFAPSRIGGLTEEGQYAMGHSLASSHQRLVEFSRDLLQIYIILTSLCFALLFTASGTTFESLVLALAANSGGAIVPNGSDIEAMVGSSGLLVLTPFLLISATSIFWHRMLVDKRLNLLRKHRETYWLLLLWIMVALIIVVTLSRASGNTAFASSLPFWAEGLFNSASILSSSGMQSRHGIFSLLPPLVLLALLFLGGGAYSKSGGLKLYRFGIMAKQSIYELNRLVYPSMVRARHFANRNSETGLLTAIWSFFALAVIIIFIGAFALSTQGFNVQAAFSASIANFVTAGPSYGPELNLQSSEGWPDYSDMTTSAHWILICIMMLGRMEVIALVSMLSPVFWQKR